MTRKPRRFCIRWKHNALPMRSFSTRWHAERAHAALDGHTRSATYVGTF